ncbi:MAG: ABC transporter permease subunit [Gammaproteobacteria bacterium]|nr:ABC transporter permease subunit [Gammaproteobacteria bacterium]NKB65115.1 ABC transporter permease subunit [Gammaproteobacteria bacterium]
MSEPVQTNNTESIEAIETISPWREMAGIFFRNYEAVFGLVLLVSIMVFTFIGPFVYTTDPFEMVWAPFTRPGQEGFLFGTDYLGRDILAEMIAGGQVSIAIGLAAAAISVVIGVCIGAFAGYYGGIVEEALMRSTEFFQVLPTLLFSMVIVALFGASLLTVTFAIGIVSWPAVARVTRTEFLRIRELEYVRAARSGSAKDGYLIFRVILPNALPPIIVQANLMVGSAILFEAALSFLNLSDPNVMSWGQVIGSNRTYILDAGFAVAIPGFAIFLTVLAISLIGDGLNDALNPRLRQR